LTAWIGQSISSALLLGIALHTTWWLLSGVVTLSWFDMLLLLPYAGMIAAGRNLRRSLSLGEREQVAYALFGLCGVAALLVSFRWFQDPMHDIALWFGSHGRWGCSGPAEDGSDFLLNDSTVPELIFLPILLATAGLSLCSYVLRAKASRQARWE
jgi:hypothetical protein